MQSRYTHGIINNAGFTALFVSISTDIKPTKPQRCECLLVYTLAPRRLSSQHFVQLFCSANTSGQWSSAFVFLHTLFWGGGCEGGAGAVVKTRARRAAGLSRDPPIQTTVRAHGHTWALRLCAAALSVSGLVVLAERRTLVASRPHGASQTHIWARAHVKEQLDAGDGRTTTAACPLYPLPNRPICSSCQAEQNTRDIQNTAFF